MTDKHTLAKVTGELSGARGPDVRTMITVPASLLLCGGQLLLARPRLASCERCHGGGCATCGYQGAFQLAQETGPIPLQLPASDATAVVTVRLPHLGFKRETDEVAGHWLVEVHPGSGCSAGVTLGSTPARGQAWGWKLVVMLVLLATFWAWLNVR
jgi:hypothetical protein